MRTQVVLGAFTGEEITNCNKSGFVSGDSSEELFPKLSIQLLLETALGEWMLSLSFWGCNRDWKGQPQLPHEHPW